MQQPLGQTQLGQSPQMVQQSSLAQQQMAQQQINQSQITQQQLAQSQLAQQQIAQQQQQQQHQMAQTHMAQQQLAQQQIAQSQLVQQHMVQSQLVQQQMAQSQMAQQQMNQPQIVQQQITQPQMIQQQIAQQQIGQQQLQQMMYCPTVRLVYDTPMQLMQSGDQIQQQNQNIFVNQPPWARPVQNQVIYVQQIGSNLVPVQHLDPNMFLQQNIPMYQQVVQNVPQLVQNLPQTVQSLPQGQIRQIINNLPAGVVQNFGANVQRIQEQNLGQMVQNYGIVQATTDAPMNNVTNNEVDSQAISNQTNVQNQQTAQNQELMHVYRQIVPQINQQQQTRAQVPASQQQSIPNMQTVVQQTVTSMGQTVGANNRQVANVSVNTPSSVKVNNGRPTATSVSSMNNIIRTSSSPIVNTPANNVGLNMQPVRHIIQTQNVNILPQSISQNLTNTSMPMQNYTTNVGALNTVTYSAVRNGQPYTYRAIQPKPNNNNNNIRVNFKPRGSQMQMVRRPVVPNAPNINQNIPVSTLTIPTSINYIKMETDSPMFNRKRKSESPDEIHKKISNYGSITVTAQVKDKIKAKYANTSEIGVNTSPIHKMHKVNQSKVENQLPLLQINPMEAKIKQEFLSPTNSTPNTATGLNNTILNSANVLIKTEAGTDTKDRKVSKDVGQQTEEKLVRKTVFPQAKSTGRLLDAKTSLDMPKIDEPTSNISFIHNDSLNMPLVIDETKHKVNTNNIKNNESQQMPLMNCKQSNTINEKNKLEEVKAVKSGSPNLLVANVSTANTNSTLGIQETVSMVAKTSKCDFTKVEPVLVAPLDGKKDDRNVLPLNEEKLKPDENKKPNAEVSEIKEIMNSHVDIILKLPEKSTQLPKAEALATDAKITTESDFEKEIKDNKIEKKEYKNITINEMKDKEIHIVDGNIHEEKRDFLLTHVLDGFVIQESNVPFAIRRPLKEKTVNAFVEDKTDPCIKAAKDEIRGHILELSQLHLNENKEKERIDKETGEKELNIDDKEKEEEIPVTETKEETIVENDVMKDNPFESLNQTAVKSWTVEDLATHLAKYNWTETVSTLQEHEIDGESLFLVTKTQLVTIGVNDNHAEVICEFVGNKC